MFKTDYPDEGDKRARAVAERVLQLAVLGRLLYAPSKRSRRLAELEPLDIQLLLALWRTPESTGGELSATLQVIPQTVSKSLRRLRTRGLIADAVANPDRRERRHAVTRAGRTAVQKFLADAEERLADADA